MTLGRFGAGGMIQGDHFTIHSRNIYQGPILWQALLQLLRTH